jgi:hypothetical protein
MNMKGNIRINVAGREYNCEVDVDVVTDPNYGADADGNRGVSMDFMEEVVFTKIEDAESGDLIEPIDEESELVKALYDAMDTDEIELEDEEYDGPDTVEEARGER